jgi:hypothetical protein
MTYVSATYAFRLSLKTCAAYPDLLVGKWVGDDGYAGTTLW